MIERLASVDKNIRIRLRRNEPLKLQILGNPTTLSIDILILYKISDTFLYGELLKRTKALNIHFPLLTQMVAFRSSVVSVGLKWEVHSHVFIIFKEI